MSEHTSMTCGSERDRMLGEVRAGLTARPRWLPSKYFYDERGSRLFEEITELPEYYLTRAERRLLRSRAPELIERLRPRTLVELGAGAAEKTRILLEAMTRLQRRVLYVPVDVSAAFLEQAAARLRRDFPALDVTTVVADISIELPVPAARLGPSLFALLGSTIGNFEAPAALDLLRRIRRVMTVEDRFLLGVDLRKSRDRLEAAYNDARGVTAEFNRNILRVLNRELGADFDPAAFEHRALYDTDAHRIEMCLVSRRDQRVEIPGIGTVRFRAGEPVRTEISCKYDQATVIDLFDGAGLRLDEWAVGAGDLFALALARPT